MFKNKKIESDGLDNFLRLFPKVMKNKELTLLQKIIISDVISRQIQGQPYFKTSGVLAEELGTYKKKTIQMNFQYLESFGYLNTRPYNDGKHANDLREAEVLQIEKWIFSDDFLEKSEISILPTVKKNKDGDYAWNRKRRKRKLVFVDVQQSEFFEDVLRESVEIDEEFSEEPDEVSVTHSSDGKTLHKGYPLISLEDDVDNGCSIGESFIEQYKSTGSLPFEFVYVDYGGGTIFDDEVLRIPNSSKYFLKSTLMMIDNTLFPE
ncbi:hypothetical protein SAMN05444484_102148 [Flavobacterium chilense]|uniref:Helix-turn-helix domain-containing protein n=2 Tax=Flavobacterium chilense TaxID=946677 RepID=A0A1M7CGH7_9FLAO|nr:hypothetical protein SAMN05444484_102148 [Flavobacterium chilense]